MTEQKAKKKELGICKRIQKWIGLALLFLLLIAALFFHAPWKVITLLFIILAACTVLPKPYRKWFWLSVAAIVVVLIIWVFLPTDNEGWRPYTFDEELAAMEAKRSVSTEDNAANIYNQLLESYDPNSFSKDFLSWENEELILSEFWESKDYPEVASWLEDNRQIIDQLMLACKKDKCRFPIAGDISTPGLKPPADAEEVREFWGSLQGNRLVPMRRWGELLVCSANNDIAEGRLDEGLEKYIATLQMAKHLYQQPIPMDLMVGIAINLSGLDQINEYIMTGDANDEHLQLFKNALQSFEYDWQSDSQKIRDREKLMLKSFICAMFYQTNQEGKVRLNREPKSTLRALIHDLIRMVPPEDPESTWKPMNHDSYWQIKFTKAMSVLCWFFVPSTPQKTAVIIDDIHQQYYSTTEPEYDWKKEPKKFTLMTVRLNFRRLAESMSGILVSNWQGLHDRYLRSIAEQRGTLLIVALRRYKNKTGQWPQKLDEVKSLAPAEIFIDPINDGSFVYKLTEENFTLYSKGKNNIDEDGKYKRRYGETSEGDDWLIWPPKTRKTKNEKADSK
jgi:hypothetical protein